MSTKVSALCCGICVYAYVCACGHARARDALRVHMPLRVSPSVRACVRACVRASMRAWVRVYVHMFVSGCVLMFQVVDDEPDDAAALPRPKPSKV